MYRNGILLIIFGLSSGVTFAQATADDPWAGTASLGYLSTAGNTDTTSYNSKFEISHARNKWKHTFNAAANGALESDTTTAEAYQAGWKSAYDISEYSYLFGQVRWRKDRFAGVREQLSEAVGYGRRIFDTPAHLLSAEIGAGYTTFDFADRTSESSVILTLGIDYKWIFSETSNFEQIIDVESASENTYIESVSAVRARLLGDFALVLSYTVKHNTDVPVGRVRTDKLSAVSLEYAF